MKNFILSQTKIVFVVFFCFTCMTSVKAQAPTFSILPSNTQTMTLVCDSIMADTIYISNPTTTDIGLSYEVITNTLPNSNFWGYTHCDWAACIPGLPTGIRDVPSKIPADTKNFSFILDINSHQHSDQGSLVLKFYETNIPANAVIVTWNVSGCSPLGISEPLNNTNFILYPNPAEDFVNVRVTSGYTKSGTIQVYNLVGDKLMEFTEIKNSVQKIDLTGFPTGAYFVKYSSNEGASVKKVFKTR